MISTSATIEFNNTETAFRHLSDERLKEANRLFKLLGNRLLAEVGAKASSVMLEMGLPIEGIVKAVIYDQFCGGETLEKCIPKIEMLAEGGVKTLLDFGVEGKAVESEYDRALNEKIKMIEFASDRNDVVNISCKPTGLAAFDLFKRIQSGSELSNYRQEQLKKVRNRFYQLCKTAYDHNIRVYIDAEESWIQDPIDEIANEMMAEFNKKSAVVSNTFQLYRNDRLEYLKNSFDHAQANHYILGAKLVRGAYVEKERKRARKKHYPSPIHENKQAVDQDYNAAIRFCVDRAEQLYTCNATHNEESCLLFAQLISEKQIPNNHPNLWTGQLYGMGEHISFNLAKAGFNVFKQIPYGPVREVIPYLTRRAEENKSVGGQMGRELKLIQAEMRRRGL